MNTMLEFDTITFLILFTINFFFFFLFPLWAWAPRNSGPAPLQVTKYICQRARTDILEAGHSNEMYLDSHFGLII